LRHLVLYSASGRFDFLPSASAHLDAAHDDTLRGIAIREKLGGTLSFANQSRFGQGLLRYFGALRQLGKVLETDDLILYTKDIREPALWYATGERHLTALELRLAAAGPVVAGSGLDTLVSLARRLTGARAGPTSDSLAIPVRSGRRNQIVQPDLFDVIWRSELFPTCWFVWHSLILYRRHFDEMTHVLDLSA
jgi:hypothetical protein